MMQSLTADVWQKHYTELRPIVLEEFPQLERADVEAANDDFQRLVEEIQRATHWSADQVHRELANIDVQEAGVSEEEVPQEFTSATLDQLRLGAGFSEGERGRVVNLLSKLNRRLKKFQADGTQLELSVKDRETPSQKVTLECWLPKFPHIVATSQETDLKAALMDVREDLWRQIDDLVNKRKEGAR